MIVNTALLMAAMAGAGYFNSPRLIDESGLSMKEWCGISEAFERIGVEGKINDFCGERYYEYDELDMNAIGVEIMTPHYDEKWIYHEEIYTYDNNEVVVIFYTNGNRFGARVHE